MRFSSIQLVHLAVWSSGVLALLATATPASAQFIRLGDLPGGNFSSRATAVSDDGSVVVGNSSSAASGANSWEPFRWTRTGGMVGLGFLPGKTYGVASDVSADGSAVVGLGELPSTAFEGFHWTAASGMVGLGFLPGGRWSSASSVSANGAVVVGWSTTAGSSEAFRWTQAGGMVGLGDLPGGPSTEGSAAGAVSRDGSVVVGEGRSAAGREAFRWTQATGMVGLGDLPGGEFWSYANAVSADGSVVVGRGGNARNEYEAFRWTPAGGMVGLGSPPGGRGSGAHAVSADGSVVVGNYLNDNNDGRFGAFIWTSATGMRNLQDMLVNDLGYNLTGWSLGFAQGISADGRWVVGRGINPSGQDEAYLANIAPIPEPSSVALAGLGLAGLAGYGWRRRRRQTVGSRREQQRGLAHIKRGQ
jgi:probable HAF family extracellular repeat protein